MEYNRTPDHTPVPNTTVLGYRDPEPVNYNDSDFQDSLHNQYLRERCGYAELHPRFGTLPAGDEAFQRAFVLKTLADRSTETAEDLEYFKEEKQIIIELLEGEKRAVVRTNRKRLKNEVEVKIIRVRNSATDIQTGWEMILAQGEGKLEVQPLTPQDRDRLYGIQDARYINGGREVPDGTIVVRIDGSHSEPL